VSIVEKRRPSDETVTSFTRVPTASSTFPFEVILIDGELAAYPNAFSIAPAAFAYPSAVR
jgi:hypothetical protein